MELRPTEISVMLAPPDPPAPGGAVGDWIEYTRLSNAPGDSEVRRAKAHSPARGTCFFEMLDDSFSEAVAVQVSCGLPRRVENEAAKKKDEVPVPGVQTASIGR